MQNENLIVRSSNDNQIGFLVPIEIAGTEHITGDPRLSGALNVPFPTASITTTGPGAALPLDVTVLPDDERSVPMLADVTTSLGVDVTAVPGAGAALPAPGAAAPASTGATKVAAADETAPPGDVTLLLGIETLLPDAATVSGVATVEPVTGGAVLARDATLPPADGTLVLGIEALVPNTATLPGDATVEPVTVGAVLAKDATLPDGGTLPLVSKRGYRTL